MIGKVEEITILALVSYMERVLTCVCNIRILVDWERKIKVGTINYQCYRVSQWSLALPMACYSFSVGQFT